MISLSSVFAYYIGSLIGLFVGEIFCYFKSGEFIVGKVCDAAYWISFFVLLMAADVYIFQ